MSPRNALAESWWQPLPRNVVALGVVSLLMGTSSQMILSLPPLFLATVLGASTVAVGIIEGIAEATNAFAKVFSGTLSDWTGRREPLVVLGYGLAALSKPLFPMAGDAAMVLAARFIDRTGKGIRDAPRDALLADELPARARGSGFGLRLALFTVGSVIGPLLAIGIMLASGGDFRLVFWIATIPAALCVVVLVIAVKEPANIRPNGAPRLALRDFKRLPAIFWWLVTITAVLWGLQMGITQGLVAAAIADAAPDDLRGTAFGIYYLVDGVASLLASSGAGILWRCPGSREYIGNNTVLER